jgi:hypothetical protein
MLISYHYLPYTVFQQERTALWEATHEKHSDVIEALLERGADINLPGNILPEYERKKVICFQGRSSPLPNPKTNPLPLVLCWNGRKCSFLEISQRGEVTWKPSSWSIARPRWVVVRYCMCVCPVRSRCTVYCTVYCILYCIPGIVAIPVDFSCISCTVY